MSQWMRQRRKRTRVPAKTSASKGKRCFGFRSEIKLERKPKNLLFVPGNYTSYRGDTEQPDWVWLRHKFVDPSNQVTRQDSSGSQYSRDFMASFMCTRVGTPDYSGDCSACDRNNPRMDDAEKDKRLSAQTIQHWTVIDLDWYYKVVNKWGDVTYEQPSSAAEEKRWVNEGHEKVFGKLGYVNFGPLHASQFDDQVMKAVERMCGGCEYELGPDRKYDGGLEPALFTCKACGEVVEDLAVSEWTGSQIEAASYGDSDIKCPSCGHVDTADIEWGCTACDSPTEVDLFDCVIPLSKNVTKTENGKIQSSILIPTGRMLKFATDFKLPNGEALARHTDAGELEFNPMIRDKYSPIDFKGDLFKLQFDPEYQHSLTNGALSGGVTPRAKG